MPNPTDDPIGAFTDAVRRVEVLGRAAAQSVLEKVGPAWDFRDLNSYIRDALTKGFRLSADSLPRSIDLGPINNWINDLRESTDRHGREVGYQVFFSPTEAKWARSRTMIVGDEEKVCFDTSEKSRVKNAFRIGDIHTHPSPEIPILASTSDFSLADVQGFITDESSLMMIASTPGRTLMMLRLKETRDSVREAKTFLDELLRQDAVVPTLPSANFAARIGAALYASPYGPTPTLFRVYPVI